MAPVRKRLPVPTADSLVERDGTAARIGKHIVEAPARCVAAIVVKNDIRSPVAVDISGKEAPFRDIAGKGMELIEVRNRGPREQIRPSAERAAGISQRDVHTDGMVRRIGI